MPTPDAGGGRGSSLVPAGGTLGLDSAGVPKIEISHADPTPPAAPAASLDVTSIDFGTALVGTTSAAQTVTLTNSGTGTLSVTVTLMTDSVSVSASTADPNPANNAATVTTKAH